MNILITSPRAPAVLEWIQIALRGGHRVTLCDSLRFPIARFVRSDNVRYWRLPAPKLDFDAYQDAIKLLIADADLVIPTCEDIFYLALVALNVSDRDKCLMPEHDLLMQLHHKIDVFSALPKVESIAFPTSRLITQYDDIIDDNHSGEKTVLKPVFSRFGREVVRGVSAENTRDLTISSDYPWVQQQFIDGEALCNFAICQHGKLIANAIYRPRYLLNQSASTYFEDVRDSRIDTFMCAFAQKHHFHGQVAFDFIDDGEKLWVLECNPRVTSGIHLLGDYLMLNKSGELSLNERAFEASASRAYRVGASLPLLFGFNALKNGRFAELIADFRRADDVVSGLPFYAPLLSFTEIIAMSLRQGKSLSDVATFDIEYDGL